MGNDFHAIDYLLALHDQFGSYPNGVIRISRRIPETSPITGPESKRDVLSILDDSLMSGRDLHRSFPWDGGARHYGIASDLWTDHQ